MNTLAYYGVELIAAVDSLMIQASGTVLPPVGNVLNYGNTRIAANLP
jgi:hypothetical protein